MRLSIWFSSFVLIFTLFLTSADVSRANPPAQDFEGDTFASADGSSVIRVEETQLTADYFSNNGTLDGLHITDEGLSLEEGQSSGTYVSAEISSPLAYTSDIVPLWSADLPEGTSIEIETRLAGTEEWLANREVFYPIRNDEHSGSLIWVDGENVSLEFRITLRSNGTAIPTLHTLSLIFSDTSEGPSDSQIASEVPEVEIAATCPIGKPSVVSRTQWGNPEGQSSPRAYPRYAGVTHVVVHQAETPNTTSPYSDYAGWVRSIWNYHANILGWGDIGYNYLIDPNGVIYEGRAGGNDVIGFHDGYNTGSMGVGMIGCYGNCDDPRLTVSQPSTAMMNSAKMLIGWKLAQKGISPYNTGHYANRYNVPVIAGGRDVVDTTSPGTNIYNQLPTLRYNVANLCNSNSNTPTPTPTPSDSTPTPTPSPTPTTQPSSQNQIGFSPSTLILSTSDTQKEMVAKINNASGVFGIELELSFDPSIINAVSTKLDDSASIFETSGGFVAENQVNNATGRIRFAATLLGTDTVDGNQTLFSINWEPISTGSSTIKVEKLILVANDNSEINGSISNGTVQVSSTATSVNGQAKLQGRQDYAGITISNANGQVQSNPDGTFTLTGDEEIVVSYPNYLSAKAESGMGVRSNSGDSVSINLGSIVLLAGDLNNDNLINILDISAIASQYGSTNQKADLNQDGKVNILDLSLAASNYQKSGPLMNWE